MWSRSTQGIKTYNAEEPKNVRMKIGDHAAAREEDDQSVESIVDQ